MADSDSQRKVMEEEDSGNTGTAPSSPRGSTNKAPLLDVLAAINDSLSDDEVIITDATERARLHDEEKARREMESHPLDTGIPVDRVTSPPRHPPPPAAPRGPDQTLQFPQDIRLAVGGGARSKDYVQRPPGHGFYGMPPPAPTREQQDNLDLHRVVMAQGSQLDVLRGTINGIGDDVIHRVEIMNGAYSQMLAENVNAMRAVVNRVSRLEVGMQRIESQMTVLQNMLECLTNNQSLWGNASMENNTSGGNGPDPHRTSPQPGSPSGHVTGPADSDGNSWNTGGTRVEHGWNTGLPPAMYLDRRTSLRHRRGYRDLKEFPTDHWTRCLHFRVQVSVTYDMMMTSTPRPRLTTRSRT